ncbi:MAG TPA: hypothetical protein VM120_01570 [Bryobacteraceae bacterium]|nr:hypothetical protein [Bryobacteraceae bacterium]
MRFLWLLLAAFSLSAADWKVGAAKININPTEPIWLAGYGNRDRPSEGIIQDIWIKAAAFQDATGAISVITTADLVGLDTATVDIVSGRVAKKHGIPRERLLFNYSHNHSCPVTSGVLPLYYPVNDQQRAVIERYTRRLHNQYVEVIGNAVAALAPATIEFEQGLAGFAVNRRRARPGGRSLPGPVDHDVPVMAVRDDTRKPKAILFGYSCHTTALSGYQVNGDYAGYAQVEIERANPGAIALFVMGCGGDANPLPRIMMSTTPEAVELAAMYGKILAAAVKIVLAAPMKPVRGPLKTKYGIATVPFQKPPTKAELLERGKTLKGSQVRFNDYLLSVLEKEGKLRDSHPYPVHAWAFGTDLTFIGLTGENVVDYCLRFKREYGNDNTWVAGYNNELLSYIPSLRVLKEGGYEGTEGIYEYGLPGPYGYAIEEVIAQKVQELVREARAEAGQGK